MKPFIIKINKNSFLFLLLLAYTFAQAQYTIPEIPKFQTSVYDYAGLLEPNEKQALEKKLIDYSDSTTTQIVAITIPDLKGEDISQLTTRWAHTWELGQKDKDNGILILVAKNQRKIHIVNGYGLEDRMTAGITGQIIRSEILPEFKKGDYYLGLDHGADAVFAVLKGKYKGKRITEKNSTIDLPTVLFFVFIFIVLLLLLSKNNKNNRNNNDNDGFGSVLRDIIILSSLGRGSGNWGNSGSGGGFGGGFGGGGFSGGGAGGSW